MTDTDSAVVPEVRLANDIARQFAHLAPDAAAKEVAAHIASGGESLDPLVEAALRPAHP